MHVTSERCLIKEELHELCHEDPTRILHDCRCFPTDPSVILRWKQRWRGGGGDDITIPEEFSFSLSIDELDPFTITD